MREGLLDPVDLSLKALDARARRASGYDGLMGTRMELLRIRYQVGQLLQQVDDQLDEWVNANTAQMIAGR